MARLLLNTKNLLNKNLIKIKGRGSGPGRPLLYKTTEKFLEYFGINRISDLPKLKEISELVESDAGLGRQIAVFNEKNEDTEISKDSILKFTLIVFFIISGSMNLL